jgi:hypothetical protein
MPAKPSWILHIPEIRAMLAEAGLPVVDRAVIQSIFGLGRRQAIDLLHRLGGYRAGSSFLIERTRLIDGLDRIAATGVYEREEARHEKLTAALARFRRSRPAEEVRIQVSPEAFDARLNSLPDAVHLKPGKLEIEFSSCEDLLTKLFMLAQAASNDFDGFRNATAGVG